MSKHNLSILTMTSEVWSPKSYITKKIGSKSCSTFKLQLIILLFYFISVTKIAVIFYCKIIFFSWPKATQGLRANKTLPNRNSSSSNCLLRRLSARENAFLQPFHVLTTASKFVRVGARKFASTPRTRLLLILFQQ